MTGNRASPGLLFTGRVSLIRGICERSESDRRTGSLHPGQKKDAALAGQPSSYLAAIYSRPSVPGVFQGPVRGVLTAIGLAEEGVHLNHGRATHQAFIVSVHRTDVKPALRPPSQVPGMPLAVLPPSSIAARNVGLQILGQSRTLLGCSLPSHSRVEEVVDGTRSVAN